MLTIHTLQSSHLNPPPPHTLTRSDTRFSAAAYATTATAAASASSSAEVAASAVEEAPLEPLGAGAATHEVTEGPPEPPEETVQPMGSCSVLLGEPAQVEVPDQLETCGVVVPLQKYCCDDCVPVGTQALLNDDTEEMVWLVSGHVLGLHGEDKKVCESENANARV